MILLEESYGMTHSSAEHSLEVAKRESFFGSQSLKDESLR